MNIGRHDDRVTIVGASLAGCVAAIVLAKAGVKVLLVDKEHFPRRKPCGEGLSARGQAELARVGLTLEQLQCPHQKLSGYRIYRGRSKFDISESSGLVGVSRSELDHRILGSAANLPGVDIVQGVTAKPLEASIDGFRLSLGERVLFTKHLIVADGATSSMLRALGRKVIPRHNPRLGASSRGKVISGTLSPIVHTFLIEGGEIYITPTSEHDLNISVLGDRSLVQAMTQQRSLLDRIGEIGERLDVQLEIAEPPLGCGAINTLYRGAQCLGAFVVGDACETFDPCAGLGMTHAFLSGRLAAEHLLRALSSSDVARELSVYERRREEVARDMRGFTRLTAATMTSGAGRLSLPLLVSSGLAARVTEAGHTAHGGWCVSGLISLMGAWA